MPDEKLQGNKKSSSLQKWMVILNRLKAVGKYLSSHARAR